MPKGFLMTSTRRRWSPANLTGADPVSLDASPTEKHTAGILGVSVIFTSIWTGLCVAVLASYTLQTSFSKVVWLAVPWAFFWAFGVERLVLAGMVRGRWLLLTILIRIALSTVFAIAVSETMVLVANAPEIRNEMNRTNAAQARTDQDTVSKFYSPQITELKDQNADIRGRRSDLRNKAERNQFLAECESGEAGCSRTGREGDGPWHRHYLREAEQARAELRSSAERDSAQIKKNLAEITELESKRDGQGASLKEGVAGNTGINARKRALAQLQRRYPEINTEVWVLRLLFLFIDLIPLTFKIGHVLSVRSPHDEHVKARRRQEGLAAKQLDTDAEVEERRIKDEARAQMEINRIRADRRRDDEVFGHASAGPTGPSGEPLPLIEAIDLGDYVDGAEHHEARDVDVHPDLRRGGLIALAISTAVLGLTVLFSLAAGHALSGLWLALAALALVGLLAARTKGFRRAPAWGLNAIFGALVGSLVLPVFVLLSSI